MATTETTNAGLSLDELMLRPEWRVLTPKQARFTALYLESQDPVFAANSVYNVKSEQNARLLTYELLANPKIEACVTLFFGAASQDAFLDKLQRSLEKKLCSGKKLTSADKVSLALLFNARGWKPPADGSLNVNGFVPKAARKPEREAEQKYHVGQILVHNGQRVRVKELTPDGRLRVEPVEGDDSK